LKSNRLALITCIFTLLHTGTLFADPAPSLPGKQVGQTLLTLTATDGKTVQVSLGEIEAGLLNAARKGNMVSANSINGNADGTLTITNPQIVCDGKLKTVSQSSDPNQVCRYFGFSVFTSGISDQTNDVLDLASVSPKGGVTSASGGNPIKQMNCK
jgi:hypothetical protein